MALFGGKRKNNEAFKKQLEQEALDKMNNNYDDDYTLPYDLNESNEFGEMKVKIKAPGAITAEELMGKGATKPSEPNFTTGNANVGHQNIPMSSEKAGENSADFLYKRMTESRKQNLHKSIATFSATTSKAPATENAEPTVKEPFDLQKAINDIKLNALADNEARKRASEFESRKLSPEIIPFEKTSEITPTANNNIKQTTEKAQEAATSPKTDDDKKPEAPAPEVTAAERRTSLLARCNAYLEDEEFGIPKQDPGKYKLESVENILQNFEARATQRALKNHATAMGVKPEDLKINTDSLSETPAPATESEGLDISSSSFKGGDISSTTVFSKPEIADQDVKHYFTADKKPSVSPKAGGSTAATIILDSKKIGLTPSATGNATQVFTTVSSTKDNTLPLNQEDNRNDDIIEDDEELFCEYKNLADKMKCLDSLLASKKHLSIRIAITLIMLIASILITFPLAASLKAISPAFFYGINLAINIGAIFCNLNIIKSLPALFKAQPDTDLPAAIGAVTSALQSAVCLIAGSEILPLTAVALLSLLFTNFAKRSHYSLIIKNFELVANGSTKKAVSVVTNKGATRAMVGGAISGPSLICSETETTNLQNFFKYSYCGDPTAKRIQNIALIGAIVGLGIGAAAAILNSMNIVLGVTVFAVITLISAAPATLFISHLPFKAAAGRLSYYGAMLTGYRAANELEHCNAIAVNCSELFPEGSIRLIDMKLLSPNPIDQSLLDAEALAKNIGSPLAGMFKQINNTTGNAKDLKVDSVVYEEKMGISGWVNDRRVFVGNRVLLEGHGFTNLPPAQLDKKIMRKGYFPLYIVSDNVPCAMLVVKYTPDEEIAYELRRLCNTGTTILVNNCDPNISAGMVCDYFGVYEETVAIMSKQGVEQHKIVSSYKEDKSAGAACTGGICGFLSTMTASINIKNSIASMSVLYVICTVLGIAAVGVLAFASLTSYISTLPLLIFQSAATLITFLPPLLKRP